MKFEKLQGEVVTVVSRILDNEHASIETQLFDNILSQGPFDRGR